MLREIHVDLDGNTIQSIPFKDRGLFGKALAVQQVLSADDPDNTLYLSGYTPLAASGLGFAGKLNVYGVSLLGGNLQGSRSGGLITRYLTRLGVVGIQIIGNMNEQHVLHIDKNGNASLISLAQYGEPISGAYELARRLYQKHGNNLGLAVTDPATTGFLYNAIACNARPGEMPHRVAGRSTTIFGRNGLVAVVVERAPQALHDLQFDRKAVGEIIKQVHRSRHNISLEGSVDAGKPLLGGTYGAAAKGRFDTGYGLSDLFRGARVPDEFYEMLLPENIVREQLKLAATNDLKITRHSCLPGCPNKCSQVVVLSDDAGARIAKAGEWETYQGVINLGIFRDALSFAAEVTEHSNNFAYDHIEALVALAAMALVTESKQDTGVRYGDQDSMMQMLHEAVVGETERGRLFRRGTAAIEQHYGINRHFTVGGHALPFHNGRQLVQTGVGLSWTYGRHGEACAGPGRHNFNGDPYDPSDHALSPETHVLNAIHGMVMYGAVDELGMCFFIGPTVDTLIDGERIMHTMGLEAEANAMVRHAAATIRDIHTFNRARGAEIEALPDVFYDTPTYGNQQTPEQAVAFDVPFDVVRDYGWQVLNEVAEGEAKIPERLLKNSRERFTDPNAVTARSEGG